MVDRVDPDRGTGMCTGDPYDSLPEDIFNDALELPPVARSAFLDRRCRDDAVRRDVEELLAIAAADPALTVAPDGAFIPARLGKYELIEVCGRGGMGIVFRARDLQLDRIVALKTLPSLLASDPAARERLLEEARLLAAVSDERIASIYSVEQEGEIHFLTMEYIRGDTLAERLRRGPLPLEEALVTCREVALALRQAHDRHIVHRDLKPSNVMLTAAGGVKILDFGIAKVFDTDERAAGSDAVGGNRTQACGTPAYMAPERLRGESSDARCDVWALGCLLHDALVARPPDRVADWQERRRARELPAATPRAARVALERCLAEDPARRRISAAEVARSLDRAAAQVRGGRRRRHRLLVAAVLAVAIGGGLSLRALLPSGADRTTAALARVEAGGPGFLRGVAADDRTLWVTRLAGDLIAAPHDSLRPAVAVSGRRPHGVLVPVRDRQGRARVTFLAAEDGRRVWSWLPTWTSPVNAQGRLEINQIWSLPWPGRSEPVLAVGLYDYPWYSSAIAFLDLSGRLLGTYYHPGPVNFLRPMTVGPDREVRYLVGGINSSARFVRDLVPWDTRLHCAFIAELAPPDVSGQAFPWSEDLPPGRDWPALPRAREAAYLAVPPLHPGVGTAAIAAHLVPRADGALGLQVYLADGRLLFLADDLRPDSCYVKVLTEADRLHRQGRLDPPPLMLIRDGRVSWHDVPLTY